MRITSTQLYTNSTAGISATKASLATLQNQASSGVAIAKPSDDPVGAAQSLRLRSAQAANTQYGTNIGDGLGWLGTADSALTTSENLVKNAVDLTVQGGDAALSASGRAALAAQIDGLKTDLLSAANTTYLGRHVFAGNSDTAAFDTTSYAFSGAAGSSVQRRISATSTVQVDADGGAAFGTTTITPPATTSTSVFQTLDAISTALRAGDTSGVTNGLTALNTALTAMSAVHASVGSSYARLTAAKAANTDAATTLTSQRATVEDADLAKVIVELQTQQLNYQASLAVTAKVLQPSLMSYLS